MIYAIPKGTVKAKNMSRQGHHLGNSTTCPGRDNIKATAKHVPSGTTSRQQQNMSRQGQHQGNSKTRPVRDIIKVTHETNKFKGKTCSFHETMASPSNRKGR